VEGDEGEAGEEVFREVGGKKRRLGRRRKIGDKLGEKETKGRKEREDWREEGVKETEKREVLNDSMEVAGKGDKIKGGAGGFEGSWREVKRWRREGMWRGREEEVQGLRRCREVIKKVRKQREERKEVEKKGKKGTTEEREKMREKEILVMGDTDSKRNPDMMMN
jgi:hypothetical protein